MTAAMVIDIITKYYNASQIKFLYLINLIFFVMRNSKTESQSQLISNSASDTFTAHTDEEFEDGNVLYGYDFKILIIVT